MKTRRAPSFHLPVTIILTVLTGVHATAAWAADAGDAGTSEDGGSEAGTLPDQGVDCGGGGQASSNALILFGAGCC